jgi:hypothetical protein
MGPLAPAGDEVFRLRIKVGRRKSIEEAFEIYQRLTPMDFQENLNTPFENTKRGNRPGPPSTSQV